MEGLLSFLAGETQNDARILAGEENFRLIGQFVQRIDGEGHPQWQIDRSNTGTIRNELRQNAQGQIQGNQIDKYGGTTFIFQKGLAPTTASSSR